MMPRRSDVEVTVTGTPVRDQDFESYGGATYRVVRVSLRLSFHDGGWSKPRWQVNGRRIKKDGTVGVAEATAQYDFEPESETRAQFLATARKQVRDAALHAVKAGS